jgi:chromosome segregation ATPase
MKFDSLRHCLVESEKDKNKRIQELNQVLGNAVLHLEKKLEKCLDSNIKLATDCGGLITENMDLRQRIREQKQVIDDQKNQIEEQQKQLVEHKTRLSNLEKRFSERDSGILELVKTHLAEELDEFKTSLGLLQVGKFHDPK